MAQVQLQMKMCGKSRALFFCAAHTDFESSKEVTLPHINFDAASLIDELISTARKYWENHIFPYFNICCSQMKVGLMIPKRDFFIICNFSLVSAKSSVTIEDFFRTLLVTFYKQ